MYFIVIAWSATLSISKHAPSTNGVTDCELVCNYPTESTTISTGASIGLIGGVTAYL